LMKMCEKYHTTKETSATKTNAFSLARTYASANA
jgi:hypothetical protein